MFTILFVCLSHTMAFSFSNYFPPFPCQPVSDASKAIFFSFSVSFSHQMSSIFNTFLCFHRYSPSILFCQILFFRHISSSPQMKYCVSLPFSPPNIAGRLGEWYSYFFLFVFAVYLGHMTVRGRVVSKIRDRCQSVSGACLLKMQNSLTLRFP